MIKKLIALEKPILGIYRGCQVINIALGGTMYLDIYSQIFDELLQHEQNAPSNHQSPFIQIEKDTLLHQIVGIERMKVNSRHHQSNKN